MDSLENAFNDKNADPAVKYAGYEGYERAVSEMLTSFYDAFPQYKGRVALVDLKALEEDREAELSRLSKELGVDDIEAAVGSEIKAGAAYDGINKKGGRVSVAAAWDIHKLPSETLTYEENAAYVRIAVHELAHSMDQLEGTIDHGRDMHSSNYAESYADAFRIVLSTLNGMDASGLKHLIASYDNRQAVEIQDRYDNGEMLANAYFLAQDAAEDLDVQRPIQGFSFKYWHEAKEIVDTIRANHINDFDRKGADRDRLSYARGVRSVVFSKMNKFMLEEMKAKAPHIFAISEDDHASDEDLERLDQFIKGVEYFVDDLDVRRYETGALEGLLSEEGQLQTDIAYETRKKLNSWLEERQDFIPDAGRILAGYNYLSGQGVFAQYETPNFDPLLFFGKAMDTHLHTGDDEDLRVAYRAAIILRRQDEYAGTIFHEKELDEVIDYFRVNPDAAKALGDNMTLEHALSGNSTLLPEYRQDSNVTTPQKML